MWIFLSLLSALFHSLKDVSSKKGALVLNVYVLSAALRTVMAIFVLPFLLIWNFPIIQAGFWQAFLISTGLNVFATLLYVRSLQISDLSLTTPLNSLLPVFLLVTSFFIGEVPSIFSLFGVLTIAIGAYFLGLKPGATWFDPYKILWSDRGARYMIFVIILWSITSLTDKIGVQNSSAIFWVFMNNFGLAIVLWIIAYWKARAEIGSILRQLPTLGLAGLFQTLSVVCQMSALPLTSVSNVIALKHTSPLVSVILGRLFFREKNTLRRWLAALIMIFGVLILIWK